MFFKSLKLVLCIKLTLVFLVYSANLQRYSVLHSHRYIKVYQLTPRDIIETPLREYSLTCSAKKPLECTVTFYASVSKWKIVFNYQFLGDKFKTSTGTFFTKLNEVDYSDRVHLTKDISVSYSNGYYYNPNDDSLKVWESDTAYDKNSVFYQGFVNETVDRYQKPTNIRFSVCNNTYNLKITDEFGRNVFKTNQKDIFARKELTTTSTMTTYDCSVRVHPEVIKKTTLSQSQTPPVTQKVETSATMSKTIINPEQKTTKESTTKLVTSTTAVTTVKTPTTTRATITATNQKITSSTNTVIPTQDASIQSDTKSNTDTTKTLLIILISLVAFLIFSVCVLIYYCKKRTASGGPYSTVSKIKLTSQRHLRESAKTDAHNEENVYSMPAEDGVLEVPKPLYDYAIVIRENEDLTENYYTVVEGRRSTSDKSYLDPKECHQKRNDNLTTDGYIDVLN